MSKFLDEFLIFVFLLSFVALVLAMFGGYLFNIAKFCRMLEGDASALFVARIAGMLFMPLGVVLGYF